MPAALVMAVTRTMLREKTQTHHSPGAVLAAANEGLAGDIPEKMFITCFYAVLEPETGLLVYANAGHDVPFLRTAQGVQMLQARGMPLGLMPEMSYEEAEIRLEAKDTVLFYTDGLIEAHNPKGEMFGRPRVEELVAGHPGGPGLVPYLVEHWEAFTGPGWEQEDDTTMIVLQRIVLQKE
jgi:serine phosphatase RsbU (regulator of sigma subunit)